MLTSICYASLLEGQGQSAGEFYTPKEVGWLMARLINPEPYATIYDPACGSGGLLIKGRLLFEQTHPDEKTGTANLWTGTNPDNLRDGEDERLSTRFHRRGYSDRRYLPQPPVSRLVYPQFLIALILYIFL